MRTFVTIFAVVCNLLLADAVTKELAVAHLKGASAIVILPVFNLAYVENRGCAWGMLQHRVWLLVAIALLALAILIWKRADFFSTRETGWRKMLGRLAEVSLYAGILGNLIDRVARGFVIDFLDFHWGLSHFPCFNFADIYISFAAGALILLSLFSRQKKK